MTKRQPAYSAVPQSCRYLSARPVLNRLVHDSENAFGVLILLAPFSRWCQVPTFWLSLHSRCPAAYQLRKHVRNSGNPRVLVSAHDLSPYPPRGSPFLIHPVGAKPTYGTYDSKSNRVSSPRHTIFARRRTFHKPRVGYRQTNFLSFLISRSTAHYHPFERAVPKPYLGSLHATPR